MRTKCRRMTLELNEDSQIVLDRLYKLLDASSNAEVIRRALRIYYGLVVTVQGGGQVVVIKPNGEKFNLLIEE